MAKLSILKGATSVLCRIFIQDSSSTTGAGLAGLVFNTGSLVCYRARDDDGNAGGTAITLATATLGTWATGGFKEKDATNMPGWYEFGIPNAALATGSRSVSIHFKGAANMAPLALEIELTGFDNQSVTDGGLSKLTSLTFTGANKVDASVRDWVGDTIPARNVTGVPLVDAKYLLGTIFPTPNTAGVPDVNAKTINNQTTSASGTITFPNATLASTTNITAGTITTVTNLTNAPTAGDFTATMKTSLNAATPTLSAGDSPVLQSGIAAAGGASTITLQTALGADSLPIGCIVKITSGTGAKQARTITAYVDSTKVATVDWAWTTAPDNTSVYSVIYADNPKLNSSLKIAGVVLADTLTTYTGNTLQTGDAYARLGAPAGASVSADIAAVKVDTAAVKVQTDKLTFTVANQVDSNVLDWKSATAPAMTGDAFARIGSAGVGLTNLGDTRIANLDAAVTTRMATFTLPTNFSSLSIDANGRAKTQSNVTKNVALAKFQFMMRDSTNHAPVTGKTVTVTRSIDGAAQGAGTLSAVTEISFGMYSVDFAAGDLNGNVIILRATAASCDDTFERIVTAL